MRSEELTGFFSYRPGHTLLHRMPPVPKVLLMLLLAALSFWVPAVPAIIAWAAVVLLSALCLRLGVKELLYDIRPALVYALMFYAASVLLNLIEKSQSPFLFRSDYLATASHLTLSMEISSLFYRTTGSSGFSRAFRSMEQFFTRRDATPFADALSLTLTFVPRVARFWHRMSLAWQARDGKRTARRIRTLVPVLFRTGMDEAYAKALSAENRS